MADAQHEDLAAGLDRGSRRERDDGDALQGRRERTPPGGSRDGAKDVGPDAGSPAVGTVVDATVASIKGSLGLFVEIPGPRGAPLNGLIHLSEVRFQHLLHLHPLNASQVGGNFVCVGCAP